MQIRRKNGPLRIDFHSDFRMEHQLNIRLLQKVKIAKGTRDFCEPNAEENIGTEER
jgi:hypothetical protein